MRPLERPKDAILTLFQKTDSDRIYDWLHIQIEGILNQSYIISLYILIKRILFNLKLKTRYCTTKSLLNVKG